MKKADALEFAILGVLHEGPLHGYELRKRLNQVLGTFHAISFGSLYPALKTLVTREEITEQAGVDDSRRTKITYRITPAGQARFETLLANAGPAAWDDDGFGVHFAFFGRADAEVRTSILEGRRMRLAERRALMRDALTRTRERVDAYTLELQRHGLEGVESEMRWLDDLIAAEHKHHQ
jgi:DNA-binding PadR family transcriptional regulator